MNHVLLLFPGYGELLTIPRGARHIKIVERHSRDVVLGKVISHSVKSGVHYNVPSL